MVLYKDGNAIVRPGRAMGMHGLGWGLDEQERKGTAKDEIEIGLGHVSKETIKSGPLSSI